MTNELGALGFDRPKHGDGIKQEQIVEESIKELKDYQKMLLTKGAIANLGEPADSSSTENLSYFDIQKKIEDLVISIINKETVQSLYDRAEVLIKNLENSRSIGDQE